MRLCDWRTSSHCKTAHTAAIGPPIDQAWLHPSLLSVQSADAAKALLESQMEGSLARLRELEGNKAQLEARQVGRVRAWL